MNKKGLGPLAIPLIIVGILLLIIFAGGISLSSNISKIPTPVWYILAIVLFIWLFSGRKR